MNEALIVILSAIRLSTPLGYAALGGYCSERSGTINIALEGFMLIGAFSSACFTYYFHNAYVGILLGCVSTVLFSSLHALLCIHFKIDQIISGLSLNLLAAGLTSVISKFLFDSTLGTPILNTSDRVSHIYGVSPLIIGMFFSAMLLFHMHYSTRLGQYIRFSGEHPESLESQGISAKKIRWIGVLLSGFFCGLAGAYLAIDHGSNFTKSMTSGRGFIALAALIIGRWNPLGALAAAIVFGFVESSQILLQSFLLPYAEAIPVQWIQMIPYIVTLLVISGFGAHFLGRFSYRAPKALGSTLKIIFIFVFLSNMTGCRISESLVQYIPEKIQNLLKINISTAKTEIKPAQDISDNQKFITSLFHVVLNRAPSEAEQIDYLNAILQGAHYEGLYNGLIYSDEYKSKEHAKKTAPAGALKLFAILMTAVNSNTISLDEQLIEQVEQAAMTSSAYTLKRVLGENILKAIDQKKEYQEKLATWFSKILLFFKQKSDDKTYATEYEIYKHALHTNEDNLKWELLQLMHELMNTKIQYTP